MNKYEKLGKMILTLVKNSVKYKVSDYENFISIHINKNDFPNYKEIELNSVDFMIYDNKIIQSIVWEYREDAEITIEDFEKFIEN